MVMDFSKLRTSSSNRVFKGVPGVTPISDRAFGYNTPAKTGCYVVYSEPNRKAQKHLLPVNKSKVLEENPNDYLRLTLQTRITHDSGQLGHEDYRSLVGWLQSIDESDPIVKQQLIDKCSSDSSALAYFLFRATKAKQYTNDVRTDKYPEQDSDFYSSKKDL